MHNRQEAAAAAFRDAARFGNQRAYHSARFAAVELAALPPVELQLCDEAWQERASAARSALTQATSARPFVAAAFEAACTQVRFALHIWRQRSESEGLGSKQPNSDM